MGIDTEDRESFPSTWTWKEISAKWMFTQGTSTVLLVALFGVVCYVTVVLVPKHIEAIQSGYEKNAVQLKESTQPLAGSVEKLATSLDRHVEKQERMMEEIRRERAVGGGS